MKTIYRASNLVDAQRVVDLLAFDDVPAHIEGAYLAGGIGELPAGDLIRVSVADADVERALGLLAEVEPVEPLADEEPEAAVAVPAKISSFNGWVGLGFGLVIGLGLAYWLLRLPFESDRLDFNDNGVVDSVHEYQGELPVRILDDRNEDGKPDQISRGTYGGGGETESDDDFDGRFEGRMRYRNNLPHEFEKDGDGDGFFEYRVNYSRGVASEELYFDPGTGKVIKRVQFVSDALSIVELDIDRDGHLETRREHDAIGEITKTSTVAP